MIGKQTEDCRVTVLYLRINVEFVGSYFCGAVTKLCSQYSGKKTMVKIVNRKDWCMEISAVDLMLSMEISAVDLMLLTFWGGGGVYR